MPFSPIFTQALRNTNQIDSFISLPFKSLNHSKQKIVFSFTGRTIQRDVTSKHIEIHWTMFIHHSLHNLNGHSKSTWRGQRSTEPGDVRVVSPLPPAFVSWKNWTTVGKSWKKWFLSRSLFGFVPTVVRKFCNFYLIFQCLQSFYDFLYQISHKIFTRAFEI